MRVGRVAPGQEASPFERRLQKEARSELYRYSGCHLQPQFFGLVSLGAMSSCDQDLETVLSVLTWWALGNYVWCLG